LTDGTDAPSSVVRSMFGAQWTLTMPAVGLVTLELESPETPHSPAPLNRERFPAAMPLTLLPAGPGIALPPTSLWSNTGDYFDGTTTFATGFNIDGKYPFQSPCPSVNATS